MLQTRPLETGEYILLITAPELRDGKGDVVRMPEWIAGMRLRPLAAGPDPAAGNSADPQARPGYVLELNHRRVWIDAACLAPPPAELTTASLQTIGMEQVDRWHGIDPAYAPPDLVTLEQGYEKDRVYELRREAAEALAALMRAAKADGIRLHVVSAYRPWQKQQELYERRVKLSGPEQTTVAMPGHSEHQLGTAVDFTDGDEEHLLRESFGATAAGRWLREHAWQYGFAISYTRHNREQTGYAPEPWHYRYWGISPARSRHQSALGEAPIP